MKGGVVVRKEGGRGGEGCDGCSRRMVVKGVAGVVVEEERFVGMDLGSQTLLQVPGTQRSHTPTSYDHNSYCYYCVYLVRM